MIRAFWSQSVAVFQATSTQRIVESLAHAQAQHFRVNEQTQLRAWSEEIGLLKRCFAAVPRSSGWHLMMEAGLGRSERRADAILLTQSIIVVLEFKVGSTSYLQADRDQADDVALDLQYFHRASRGQLILPVLIATRAATLPQTGVLPVNCTLPVRCVNSSDLPGLMADIASWAGPDLIDPTAWQAAPYQPIPNIIDAARSLYMHHTVQDIAQSRADAHNLSLTSETIRRIIEDARQNSRHAIIFVTGVPGAGKTLCGLNACFGEGSDDTRATFLTGNPSLVHVLRAALTRDAVANGANKRDAQRRMEGIIQALPKFRDSYVSGSAPAEHVIVIDEAQRSWSRLHAVRKSQDRTVRLTDSEPAHLLDAMSRHKNWSAIVCLIGNGQEIHDGEGGPASESKG